MLLTAPMARRTHCLRRGWSVLAALGLLLLGALFAPAAFADSSATLFPTAPAAGCTNNAAGGSCRASIEWRNNFYGPSATPVQRRTLFHVYAQANEVIFLGSSAQGQGLGAIKVWNPTGSGGIGVNPYAPTSSQSSLGVSTPALPAASSTCATTASGGLTTGRITSRAQELAGGYADATSAGANGGYLACTYTAPTSGLYTIGFLPPLGDTGDTDGPQPSPAFGGDIAMGSSEYFDTRQQSSISAWEISVRPTATSTPSANIPGRVFTYTLIGITGDNGRPLNITMYVVTTDGYRYKTDTRGLDPYGFAFYGNPNGFFDTDGVTPIDHDVRGLSGGVGVGNMKLIQGSLTFDSPRYPIFFSTPANATLTALGIPTTPTAPAITAISFQNSTAAQTAGLTTNNTLVSTGGTFSITANVPGIYEIVIAQDPAGGPPADASTADYDPGLTKNRALRLEFTSCTPSPCTKTLSWDGKDNLGNDFPVGLNYPFKSRVRGGEYHFPLLDAESSPLGGPTFTIQNAPGALCAGCTTTTGNFDDRGYRTKAGVDVGTPGSPLCGAGKPASPYHSDFLTGFDTSGATRAYGYDSKTTPFGILTNTNTPCTGSDTTDSAFGDLKGLDIWTFFPSAVVQNSLNIFAGSVTNTPTPLPTNTPTPTNTPLVPSTPTNTPTGTVVPLGRICGFVWYDLNDNGVKEAGEPPIPGTTVTLTPGGATTTTAADGSYCFNGLPPGTYTVTETQPAGYNDGKDSLGSLGGTLGNDVQNSIVVPAGGDGQQYNFGEIRPPTATPQPGPPCCSPPPRPPDPTNTPVPEPTVALPPTRTPAPTHTPVIPAPPPPPTLAPPPPASVQPPPGDVTLALNPASSASSATPGEGEETDELDPNNLASGAIIVPSRLPNTGGGPPPAPAAPAVPSTPATTESPIYGALLASAAAGLLLALAWHTRVRRRHSAGPAR